MADWDAFSLETKYLQTEGKVLLTGMQALVRLPLDQHRADAQQGLRTATLFSGYRGSPLGGLDLQIQRNQELLQRCNVEFIPSVNEDLGATAIFGSQLANLFERPRYDGVVGIWYGKSPGVDRSGDIFKHGNYSGVGRYGGVLALAGDDPGLKSSTLPSHSEIALYDALMPILFPGNVQELLDFGRLGIELSRYCGLWIGMKIVTNVADAFGVVDVAADRITLTPPEYTFQGRPWKATQFQTLYPPITLVTEQEIFTGRLAAAKAFALSNHLNRITFPTSDAWLGIIAAGKTYYDLLEAFALLGIDSRALQRYGIRLLKMGMLFPVESTIVREFAQGLQEIIVFEEKRAFLELFVKDILYSMRAGPCVIGKMDEQEQQFVPAYGELNAREIALLLVSRLQKKISTDIFSSQIASLTVPRKLSPVALPIRTAHFCSGCPHSRSTRVPDGSLAGGGIGCHGMAILMDRNTPTTTHMGGEGAQWVGMAPFTEIEHIFQNMGDGTFFHSGSLALRQAIAAGATITYKILYNDAVAMTGGQKADGSLSVVALTHLLKAEGVRHIAIVTDDESKYAHHVELAAGVEVHNRDILDEVQKKLRQMPGVTVLIYDQMCAAELRRHRKRAKHPVLNPRVFINQAVCEGCGDCGEKSNCLSVFPVETEFGRKTQIHQSSCNTDYSCLQGNCPSFLTIIPGNDRLEKKQLEYEPHESLPEPVSKVGPTCNLLLMGIGGTGIVTINQIIGTAAFLDDKYVIGLDQTGLSQKGGAVVSHLKIAQVPLNESNAIAPGQVDAFLAFDLLTAMQHLHLTRADKTVAIVSTSKVPTGAMVASSTIRYPDREALLVPIKRTTRSEHNVYIDAIDIAQRLFHDHMAANMLLLGVAYQSGIIPLRATALEKAIQLNGVHVQMNLQAFRAGRYIVAVPDWEILFHLPQAQAVKGLVKSSLHRQSQKLIQAMNVEGELRRLLEVRVPALIAYQHIVCAKRYCSFVQKVLIAEQQVMPGDTGLSEAVARYLFKLITYKDEYEVARLHLTDDKTQEAIEASGKGSRVYYHLQPPWLHYLGLRKKIKLSKPFAHILFHILTGLKMLRGTTLDPFGYTPVRREERKIIEEYRALIEQVLAGLSQETYQRAVALAKLPECVSGYENIKLSSIQQFRQEVRQQSL